MPMRALRISAAVEAGSLLLLVLNLATVHLAAPASVLGPVHGCAYLIGIVLTWQLTKTVAVRALSVIPGIGTLLVLRSLRSAEAASQ
ncbi:DUF3817 domain-containing protein [Kineosporia sp. J2-2]|uniref:DUF3817 domain-containing protein n=1 Tax=Kineosporia corallincola TaxID=2835133 RepID=A0ABS5TJE7_9ACTN|nr:DUF3817 domain-containing protein [Kineosporia corallincola]MBT0771225.1 DUF3817 domain-containing protein [Kineosporia corallincola]